MDWLCPSLVTLVLTPSFTHVFTMHGHQLLLV